MTTQDDLRTDDRDDLLWLADREPRLGDPRPEATARALNALLAHAERQRAPAPRFTRRRVTRAGALLATAAAAAVAVTVGVGSLPSGHGHARDPLAPPTAAAAPLVRLTHRLSAAPPATGDATLTIKHTVLDNGHRFDGYDLVTDGSLLDYFASDHDGLTTADPHAGDPDPSDPTGPGTIHAWLAAAAAAAGDSPAAAAARINAASGIPIPAGSDRTAQVDNHVWITALSAIELDGGRPDVRAGALSAMAGVGANVVQTTSAAGRHLLAITMTQSTDGSAYYEALTIDATTGTPISFAGGNDLDHPSTATTYDVSRVDAADFGH